MADREPKAEGTQKFFFSDLGFGSLELRISDDPCEDPTGGCGGAPTVGAGGRLLEQNHDLLVQLEDHLEVVLKKVRELKERRESK